MGKAVLGGFSIPLNFIIYVILLQSTVNSITEAMRTVGSRGGQSLTNLMVTDSRNNNKDGAQGGEGMLSHTFCSSKDRQNIGQLSGEHRVKKMVLCGYDPTSRPVRNDSSTTRVNVALSLFHILDTDEKHQTFSILVSVRLKWVDEFLTWDPTEYGNTTVIHIKYSLIWTPDIVISNSADDSLRVRPETYTIVQSDGSVLWMYPAVVKVTCTLQVKHFPFDHQSCNLIFISWTYNGHQVDVYHNETLDSNKIYYKQENQEWSVGKITTKRTERIYACCPEPYPDVTITIHLDRHSLFYIFNLIFPCFLIYLTSFLAFFLPVESGEKVNLELTILLALIVFLLVIGETLPPTPDSIPLLGILFAITMIMVMVALVMGVIVTNIHFRKFSDSGMPRIFRHYLRVFHCPYHRLKRSQTAFNPLSTINDPSTHSPMNRCFNARFIHGVLSYESRQTKCTIPELDNTSPASEYNELLKRGNGYLKNGSGAQYVGIAPSNDFEVKQVTAPTEGATGTGVRGESHLSLFDDCELSSDVNGSGHATNLNMADFTPDLSLPGRATVSTAHERRRSKTPKSCVQSCRSNTNSPTWKGHSSDKVKASGGKDQKNEEGKNKQNQCICKDAESWVIIARMVDRFFFWIFTIGSVFIVALVISSVPIRRPDEED